jgi:hypothetical protein
MDYLSKLRHICALIRNAEPKIFYLQYKLKVKGTAKSFLIYYYPVIGAINRLIGVIKKIKT